MDTYLVKIKESGLRSGYFSGEELTVTAIQLDRIKENNTVEVLTENKSTVKVTSVKKK